MKLVLNKSIAAVVILATTAILSNNVAAAKNVEATKGQVVKQQSVLKQAHIKFSKDKVYEIAYVSIIPGKESQVFNDYFPKALPIAARYGGKSVGMLAVPGVKDGTRQAQMAAIFEWPSVESWLQLHKDQDFLKVVPIRDDAIAFGNPANFYTVNKDIEATFTEGKMYELANYTLKQDDDGWSSKKSIFDKFIKQEKSSALNNGSKQDIVFTPVPLSTYMKKTIDLTCGHHNGYGSDDLGLVPHMTRLREWANFESYDNHLRSISVKKANKAKNSAVKHELTLKTVFGFPQG